ncbi:MAG: serine/threonine-protein kinase [Planctomycetota bacterium]
MASLDSDANLDRARQFEGYKVLPPCVLYGKIGQGGMGAVYRGRHLNLDIDVAVKCLKPDLTGDDDQFVVRFRREARSAARINHQNVVRVFDVSEEKGLHYIVMELVQGETARQRVQRKKKLGIGEALEILYGAACGLGEAHSKGFIHRDVKPDNIMISASGQVKVADLGLAKPSGASNLSMLSGTNMVMGTPQYMPPEQWENTATVTPAADVWALGATLYYLLVGGEAIAKDSLPRIMQRIVMQAFPDVREQRPDCPEDVALLIARATDRDPEKRFVDAREMAEALERLETRRESLRDCETVLEGDHNTLLSPPPAKTLAKIKFWLDEQTQRGGDGDTMPAPGGTQPMSAPRAGRTVAQSAPAPGGAASPARRSGGLLAAVLVVLLGAAAVFVWQPWKKGGLFAEADQYEKAGNFALAVAEVERVHSEDPSLAGKSERLGRLYAAWARQALTAGELRQALLHAGQAIGYADNAASRAVDADCIQRITEQLEADLVRTAPGSQPVLVGEPVEFVGRLADPLVRELRIARQVATRGADGAFRVPLELRGATAAAVEVTLTTGRTLALADWSVRYGDAVAIVQPGTPEKAPPVQPVVDREPQPKTEPGPAEGTIGPASAALPELELTLAPERLELVGDQPARLTITVAEGAEVTVDGVELRRAAGARQVVYEVRSDRESPADVVVEVRAANARPTRRSVKVGRRDAALAFAQAPAFVGLEARGGRWATAGDSVKIGGRLDVAPARLTIDGVELRDVEWAADGTFSANLTLSRSGENRLRLRAERRFHTACEAELVVQRLSAPALTVAGRTRLQDQVAVANYEIQVQADDWTDKVTAGTGAAAVTLRRDRGGNVFRGSFPLGVGINVVPVRAVNVLGQSSSLELRIERTAAAVKPVIDAVELRVDGELEPVRAGRQAFLQAASGLFVKTNDPSAQVTINGQVVARRADGSLPLQQWLTESKAAVIEIVLDNAVGRSDVFKFFAWLDSTLPTAECETPAPTVARGKPFTLRGRWADDGGLDRDRCKLGELAIELSPRGVAKQGTWTVTHPGLDTTTEVQVVLRDRAGNKLTMPVLVTVQ